MQLPGDELFFAECTCSAAPPGARFLPELIDVIVKREIDPGKMLDLELPLDRAAEGYRDMDERRTIKAILRP